MASRGKLILVVGVPICVATLGLTTVLFWPYRGRLAQEWTESEVLCSGTLVLRDDSAVDLVTRIDTRTLKRVQDHNWVRDEMVVVATRFKLLRFAQGNSNPATHAALSTEKFPPQRQPAAWSASYAAKPTLMIDCLAAEGGREIALRGGTPGGQDSKPDRPILAIDRVLARSLNGRFVLALRSGRPGLWDLHGGPDPVGEAGRVALVELLADYDWSSPAAFVEDRGTTVVRVREMGDKKLAFLLNVRSGVIVQHAFTPEAGTETSVIAFETSDGMPMLLLQEECGSGAVNLLICNLASGAITRIPPGLWCSGMEIAWNPRISSLLFLTESRSVDGKGMAIGGALYSYETGVTTRLEHRFPK